MKKKSVIMVALSASVAIPALPASALAQLLITCPVVFRVGNMVKCSSSGRFTIDPDGNIKSVVGCAHVTNTPQPAVCTVATGGIPVTKSVKISFDKSSTMIQNGGDSFVLDRLRMSYTGAPTPATKITLPSSKVNSGVTIKIGGRAHPLAGSALGMYSGQIVVNANTL